MDDRIAKMLDEAEALARRRQLPRSQQLCLEALRTEPDCARAWFVLGITAAALGSFTKAAEHYRRAIAFDASQPVYHAHLALSLLRLNHNREALAAAAQVLAMPDNVEALSVAGGIFGDIGDVRDALSCFQRALALKGDDPAILYSLALAHQAAGQMAEAEDCYRRAVALAPGHYRAWHALAMLRRQTPADNLATPLESLAQLAGDSDGAHHLGHALAKTYEDLGDPARALGWLERAKSRPRLAFPYDAAADTRLFEAAAELAERPHTPSGSEPADAPVFIVGMPRSGTTLVERILAGHTQIHALGESGEFPIAVKRVTLTGRTTPVDTETLEAALTADAADIGRRYVSQFEAAGRRTVDKLPVNILYAGLIRRALPNARIVCLRRDPLDTCLANYSVLFAQNADHFRYSYDMAATAQRFVNFARLVDRLRCALPPDRFTELGYEDLVARPEAVVRRLLQFCGLDWQARCLDFHEAQGPVRTASASQVRRRLYSSSIGRAEKFGAGLDPMRRVLARAGLGSVDHLADAGGVTATPAARVLSGGKSH